MDAPPGKRKLEGEDSYDNMEIMPLGAGQEVGRSCVVLKYRGKTVMFDCGIHPARSGIGGLPFFDEIDPSTIDVLLITHFHLDHAAALPFFLEKTSFKGKVVMTHPTKLIYKMLLTDYLKVSTVGTDEQLYSEENIRKSMERISAVNYHQELEYHGIKYQAFNAGHVLGAAMFMVEIAGVRVLYTGDFSRDEDRHLMSAELPSVSPNVVIVESTYGVQTHEPRDERELRFTNAVSTIVRRGGRCLIPVFALGRAQEVLLILDEYWHGHPDLHSVPIYYASTLARKCMSVYQTFVSMMNDNVKEKARMGSNVFHFRYVHYLKGIEHFDDIGPSVVMASPGMLQSGLSRDLFERWAPDRKNGVVITGYSVEGTLAKHIMSEPPDVTTTAGLTIPLNLSVTYVSFSAHSDFRQTSEFLDALMPPYVVLVHGDGNEMGRLRAELARRYESKNVQVMMPKNTQTVTLKFRADKMAKTVGQLAATPPVNGATLSGVIVRKDFTHHLMTPADLHTYTQLSTTVISQRLSVAFQRPFAALHSALTQVHQKVEQEPGTLKLKVLDLVTVTYHTEGATGSVVTLEWIADPFHDMLADSIVALLLQLDATPANLRAPLVTAPVQDTTDMVTTLLTQAYGSAKPQAQSHLIEVNVDGVSAVVDTRAKSVTSEDNSLAQRIKTTLGRVSLEEEWKAIVPEQPVVQV